ncbi:uncharacterized protein [Periplaneta americana]|uniref:uncharacterized protein isoform X6 n=1 Tax=Periplaneta americana TaxID=6978 RepID=UPI0037E90F1C
MNAINMEPKVDPLAIQRSDNTDLEEKKDVKLMNLHLTEMKTECEEDNYELVPEIKFEDNPVAIVYPMVKCEAEGELDDLGTVKDELRPEVTAEENESFMESFPSKPEILEKWLVNMKRENFRPTQYSKLCSKHFEIHCFDTERFGHTFLKEGSVPTIFNFRKHLTKKTFRQKPPKKHNKISSAVKSITPPPPTPQPPISTKCFVGDFENSDMNRPTSAERCLFVARSAVSSQRKIIKNIVKKNSRTKNKTVSLQSIESHLQEKLLRNENAATLKASFFGPAEELRGLVKEPVVMDVVKLEPLIDPLALRTSDNIDLEENIPLCEEVNSLNLCSTEIKVESENHNNDMTSGIKFEEIPAPVNFPMVKHEAEEGNVLDLHMTPIKTECIDQTCDLTSEIKVEENSMKINFPMMKNEAEVHWIWKQMKKVLNI